MSRGRRRFAPLDRYENLRDASVSAAAERQVLAFGEFFLDATQRLLFRADGEPVALVGRAFDTLLFMVEHPVELLDKKTLMHAIWPDVIVEENNLSQNIFIVRRALGEAAGEHRFIVTVPGRGFGFVAPVRRLDAIPQPGAPAELQRAESQPASTALDQEAAAAAINGTPATVDTPLEPRSARSRARIALWGLAGTALALIIASFLWFFARPTEDSTPTSAAQISRNLNRDFAGGRQAPSGDPAVREPEPGSGQCVLCGWSARRDPEHHRTACGWT